VQACVPSGLLWIETFCHIQKVGDTNIGTARATNTQLIATPAGGEAIIDFQTEGETVS
jgi:hypothetical protein